MVKTHKRIGSRVSFMYPARGVKNFLRRINGVVVGKGVGKSSGIPYLVVQEDTGVTRTLSTTKIVMM